MIRLRRLTPTICAFHLGFSLDLHGCIITIDAMGCQKGIARQIVDGGSDYLLAVKSNQRELYGNIKDVFECAAQEGTLS